MNPQQFPLNQPVVVTSNADFTVTTTRVDDEWMETAWGDQRTGDTTLKVRHRIDGTMSQAVHVDLAWWRLTVNGRPGTQADFEDLTRKPFLHFKVEPANRDLSITV